MLSVAAALAMLQYGDSAYPAGGFAFSWGVEGLAADRMIVNRSDLDALVIEQLRHRWNSMDRILLLRSFDAPDLDAIRAVDILAHVSTASAEMRAGSHRAGRSLLGVSRRAGGALSAHYHPMVSADDRLGHLPVAQALAYRDAGLDRASAQMVSGWTLVTGLLSAAVRLGLVGFIEAQHSQTAARGELARLIGDEPDPATLPSTFTPLTDIAVSRGPVRHIRMFST